MDKPEKRKFGVSTEEGNDELSSDTLDKRRKVIGPSLPPPQAAEDSRNSDEENNSDSDSDSDDDDDFGPSLPPPGGAAPSASVAAGNNAYTSAQTTPAPEPEGKPQRDAWMLLPPSELDRGSSRVDPTKLKNRKFQTGRAAGSNSASGGGVDATWTETPEEKMKRLQNEAMGISSGPARGGSGGDRGLSEREAQKSEAMREKIHKYNEQKWKETGAEAGGRVKEKEEEEDDPSSRAFDKEKDMALSSKLTHAQRRELINKASDFGSRFTKGKFL